MAHRSVVEIVALFSIQVYSKFCDPRCVQSFHQEVTFDVQSTDALRKRNLISVEMFSFRLAEVVESVSVGQDPLSPSRPKCLALLNGL